MSVLVVGADGAIGGALYGRLKAGGPGVYATTRRESAVSDGVIYLDLADVGEVSLPRVDAVVICAAITSLHACRAAPEATRHVNVDAPLRLARRCVDDGARVLVLSTNLVFDGRVPGRSVAVVPHPQSEYGRQKAQLERGILALGDAGCVVRLTKVVSAETVLLQNWRTSLAKGETITPYTDMVMAPISLGRVVDALVALTQRHSSGIYQLSATEDVSYADAAFLLADILGTPKHLVCPRAAPEDIPSGERPTFTSLDTARAQAELNWEPIAPADSLKSVLA